MVGSIRPNEARRLRVYASFFHLPVGSLHEPGGCVEGIPGEGPTEETDKRQSELRQEGRVQLRSYGYIQEPRECEQPDRLWVQDDAPDQTAIHSGRRDDDLV